MTTITATSNPFAIYAEMDFLTEPVATDKNTVMADVEVKITDLAGTTLTSYTGQVTIAIGTNPGTPTPGVLSGTLNVAAVAGVATFDDLQISQYGDGYTLVASATDMSNVTSAAFNVAVPAGLTAVLIPTEAADTYGMKVTGGYGSINPATYNGATILALHTYYNAPGSPSIASFFLSGVRAQSFFTSITVGATTLTSASADEFQVSGGNTQWQWYFEPLVPEAAGFYSATIA